MGGWCCWRLWGVALPAGLPRVALLVPVPRRSGCCSATSSGSASSCASPTSSASTCTPTASARPGLPPAAARRGLLAHATYVSTCARSPTTTASQAGRELFRLACTRCHTTSGVNGVTAEAGRTCTAPARWDRDAVKAYLPTMHNARPFMPPFPGTDLEAGPWPTTSSRCRVPRRARRRADHGVTLPEPAPAPPGRRARRRARSMIPLETGTAPPGHPAAAAGRTSWLLEFPAVVLFLAHILFVNLMVGGSLLTVYLRDPRPRATATTTGWPARSPRRSRSTRAWPWCWAWRRCWSSTCSTRSTSTPPTR